MTSESFSQKTITNSNTDILLRNVESYSTKQIQAGLLDRSNSNLKYCLKKNYKEISKTNPQLSLKSKNLIWKPRTSISAEFCESNYSPIAKRLYSLVNSKNVTPCQFTLTNNNCTPINFAVSNSISTKDDKDNTLNKSTLTENIREINHNKLRGFFKHISVEKSGLSIKPAFNVISKSIKSKSKKSNKVEQKIECNGDNTSMQLNKDLSLPLTETIKTETTVKFKDIDKLSDNNSNKKKYLEVIKNDNQIEFKNGFQNINMNSSNCTDVKFQNPIVSNKSICSSSGSPQNTTQSESLEKNYGSEKDLTDQLSNEKVVINEELDKNKKSDNNNKLNLYLNRFYRSKNKSDNKNKIKTNSFKMNIFDKKCESETIVLNDSSLINGKNSIKDSMKIVSKENEEKLKYSWNSNIILEKLNKPSIGNVLNKGDCEIKSKTAFTKKIFKIFSQSGQISKKSKLIRTSSETINNIATDNLLNLITILSVELIMSPNWYKNTKNNDLSNSKINGKNDSSKSTCNELILHKESFSKPLRNSDKSLIMTKKSSLHNTSNPSKKMTLTFDFNGRVIKDYNESDPQLRINNYLHHGSLGSLNKLTNKNSSTLSIPIRYAHENQLFRSQRFPVHPTDKDSINSNNLRQKPVNKFGLFQDHQLNKSRDYKSVYNSPGQYIVNDRKINSQQTYQFKPLSGNLKNKGKGDYRSSHERLSVKSTIVKPKEIIFKSNKQFVKDNKQNIYDKDCSDDKIEKGNYKFSTQIKSRIDFLMLDEVFELKEELYNNCAKSMIYIRQKNKINNLSANTNKHVGECWFLHVESPTSEALKNSLKIVANRFPEWNLQQYIDN